MKIDFVISVRNRDNKRIQRCINSLNSEITEKIIVVDYGSKVPIKLDGCEVMRVNTKNIWNKAHALNIGIRKCKSEFIGTVDCDMVIGKEFLNKCKKYITGDNFIFTKSVKRIDTEILDWNLSRRKLNKIATNWFAGKEINSHEAVGGIQIFPRWWIEKVRGYDENFTYWGGIDNDIHDRAFRTGLTIIDLNEIILHQEHLRVKEENLSSPKEMEYAYKERVKRRLFLQYKHRNNMNIGSKIWGDPTKPQQNKVNIEVR